ncbi:hypothetical protein FOZ76_20180 [Verticiella sediminum]|uniref:Uncharacterized protein n=1 Tax=Verticiella sediminum TaxID=1247510 RepID=A0A556ABB4_9BURK|nr:hypothetical protein [Verticiella sediminum]TSH90161.1 hypothetical protein FOZ76_20180 [Verticiella sediminum]
MKNEIVLRLLPLQAHDAVATEQALPPGTQVFLAPVPDFPGVEDAVVVSLDPDGAQPVGRVPGNDNSRLFTRLTRGSIASAQVQGAAPRGGVMLRIRVEDFGNSGLPVDTREVLPSRPPRRTAVLSLAEAPTTFERDDVNAWVRQIAARIGEAESRGEDMQAFMDDQFTEMRAYEARLPPASRQRLREWYYQEVSRLDEAYGPAKAWLSGQEQPKQGGIRRWLWLVVILLLVIGMIYEAR